MARTREFDQDEVLDKALRVFWQKGYEATSLSDLLEATGLARQSLYNAFGDKHGLFIAALQRYVEGGVRLFTETLEKGSARSAIRRLFDQATGAENRNCGCLLVNSATELLPSDAEVGRIVAWALAWQERALAERLRKGVREGELSLSPKRIEQTARFLVATLQGLRVLVKSNPEPQMLRDAVAVALRAID